MSEVKVVQINSVLLVSESSGKLVSSVPQSEEVSINLHLNSSTKEEEFDYVLLRPGELGVSCNSDEFLFDINRKGELIAIYPDNFNFLVNSEGELILEEEI